MRWLVSLLVVVVAAVGLALAGRYDPGYVVLVYPPWRLEISFITFVLLLLLLVAALLFMARVAAVTLRLPQIVRERRARREAARRDANFTGGLAAFVEARFQDADDALGGWEGDATRVGVARIFAARAAHQMNALARRDAYLTEARTRGALLAAHLAEAEFRIDARDYVGALAAIEAGQSLAPRHTGLLRLELKARQQLGHWQDVARLVDALARANAIDADKAEALRRAAIVGTLRQRGDDERFLLEYWKKVPEALRSDALVARAAAEAFVRAGGADTALEIITSALKRGWDEGLARLYGSIRGSDPQRQIEQAEKWLAERPRDADLLLALAELCSAQELWGKAQSYLEASLAVAPSTEAHMRLAELKEKTGQTGAACAHYREALRHCVQNVA
jgi:HemY protein